MLCALLNVLLNVYQPNIASSNNPDEMCNVSLSLFQIISSRGGRYTGRHYYPVEIWTIVSIALRLT